MKTKIIVMDLDKAKDPVLIRLLARKESILARLESVKSAHKIPRSAFHDDYALGYAIAIRDVLKCLKYPHNLKNFEFELEK